MKMKVVMKIGGGILRDEKAFHRVAEIIKAKIAGKEKVVVVISALYGVTDLLIEDAKKCFQGEKQIGKTVAELKERHFKYLAHLPEKNRLKTEKEISGKLEVLKRFLYGAHYLKELSDRTEDMIMSFGERLSPFVLKAYLEDVGVKAEVFDAEKAGIRASGPFKAAVAEMHETRKNLRKRLLPAMGKSVPIVAGYYGVDAKGNVKTFGRGGTDYSAGVVAACIGAGRIEFWKDVDGFMTANPEIVGKAEKIRGLSYEEAEELGYIGAKIMHPKTVIPIRAKGIPLELKNVFRPLDKGTIVSGKKTRHEKIMKSVAMKEHLAAITIANQNRVITPEFMEKVFHAIDSEQYKVEMIASSQTAVSFAVDEKIAGTVIEKLRAANSQTEIISAQKGLALIGVVGEGMKGAKGIAAKIFSCLARKGVNIELISQGAGEINISALVNGKDAVKAVRAIHKEFIEA